MGTFRVTVETRKAGQAHAYADSIGIYRIYVEWIPYNTRILEIERDFVPYDGSEDLIRQWAKGFYGWSVDKTGSNENMNENMNEHFASTLTRFERIDKGIWEWEVREAFTD